jgi:hypothetical protein
MTDEKTQQPLGVASDLTAELGIKLWAVNIPPEPDSKMLFPVLTLEIGQELVTRLKKEAVEALKMVGDIVSEEICLREWSGTHQQHNDFLKNHPNWWHNCTFLD